MKHIKYLVLPVFACALLVGCGQSTQTPAPQTTNAPVKQTDQSKSETQTQPKTSSETVSIISPQEAMDVYQAKYAGFDIYEVKYEVQHPNIYVYKIDGKSSNQVAYMQINAQDKSIIKDEVKDETKDDKFVIDFGAIQPIDELIDLAQNDMGQDYILHEWELRHKDHTIRFDIELKTTAGAQAEYEIDATNGNILEKKLQQ